jgi:hypothetical protein
MSISNLAIKALATRNVYTLLGDRIIYFVAAWAARIINHGGGYTRCPEFRVSFVNSVPDMFDLSSKYKCIPNKLNKHCIRWAKDNTDFEILNIQFDFTSLKSDEHFSNIEKIFLTAASAYFYHCKNVIGNWQDFGLNLPQYYIAGGALSRFYHYCLGTGTGAGGDIDVWCKSEEERQSLLTFMHNYELATKPASEYAPALIDGTNAASKDGLYTSEFKSPITESPYQFILYKSLPIDKLTTEFDFEHAKSYYDFATNTLNITPDQFYLIKHKILRGRTMMPQTFVANHSDEVMQARTQKYLNMGWTIG